MLLLPYPTRVAKVTLDPGIPLGTMDAPDRVRKTRYGV